MTPSRDSVDATELRRTAEGRLSEIANRKAMAAEDMPRLLHELEVHQIELEMQNEELRAARGELETIAHLYEDLYEFSPVGYVTLDRAGVIRAINLTGAGLLRVERGQLIGRRLHGFLADSALRGLEDLLEGVFGGKTKQIMEFSVSNSAAVPIHLRVEAAPALAGGLCRAALSDVTNLKLAQDEALRLDAELRQAHKMESMGLLVGGIAHDFNKILTPILAFTEMALITLPTESPVHRDLHQILQAVERAKDLVGSLLAASRNESGVEHGPVDLSAMILETMELARPTLPPTVQLDVDVALDCGPVLGASMQLQRVLLNLLANARDAMADKCGRIVVSLRRVGEEDLPARTRRRARRRAWLALSVADTGTGMTPAVAERVFEPYFTTKPGKGSGLGLAVAHGLVLGMGGDIQVHSAPGLGARFDVLLPEMPRRAKDFRTCTT